jgi:predicted RNA-binding protein with RPS1 domain
VVNIGDEVLVEVVKIDEKGRVDLRLLEKNNILKLGTKNSI